MVHVGRGSNKKGKCISHILHTNIMSCKYRTTMFSLLIRPLFPSFLHQYCLTILYATNVLIGNVFITCVIRIAINFSEAVSCHSK